MDHIFLKELQPGQVINGVYVVSQPILRNTTKGDLYIAMYLSDKTAKVNARMWQARQETYDALPSEGFVYVKGKSELYQNAMQIVINDVVPVSPDQVNASDYLPVTEKNVDEMFAQTKSILSAIKNEFLSAIVQDFLNDTPLMNEFRKAPAAMKMHHNFLGGLLEHTNNMLNVAVNILPLYPKVQSDLVLAGIFLHDIAKTKIGRAHV